MKVEAPSPGGTGQRGGRSTDVNVDTDILAFPVRQSSPCAVGMTACPKWNHCSAPICPLHEGMLDSRHLRDERVCFYLLELVKPGGRANIGGVLPTELANAVERAHPTIVSRYGPVKKALKRASTTPSRLGRQPGKRAAIGANEMESRVK